MKKKIKKEVLPLIHGPIDRGDMTMLLSDGDILAPSAALLQAKFDTVENILKEKRELIAKLTTEIKLIESTQPERAKLIRNEYPFVEYLTNHCSDRLDEMWKESKRDPFKLVLNVNNQIVYDSIVDAFFGNREVECIDLLSCRPAGDMEFRFKDKLTKKILTILIPQCSFDITNYENAGKFQIHFTEDNICYEPLIMSFDADECKKVVLDYLSRAK